MKIEVLWFDYSGIRTVSRLRLEPRAKIVVPISPEHFISGGSETSGTSNFSLFLKTEVFAPVSFLHLKKSGDSFRSYHKIFLSFVLKDKFSYLFSSLSLRFSSLGSFFCQSWFYSGKHFIMINFKIENFDIYRKLFGRSELASNLRV